MKYKIPRITVDAIMTYKSGIVLVKRKYNPEKGKWAFPGGHLKYGECLEDAVIRETKEETNLLLIYLKQLRAYSDPSRDPRGHYITMVFTGVGHGNLMSGDDAKEVKVFSLLDVVNMNLAFDHSEIFRNYLEHMQGGR